MNNPFTRRRFLGRSALAVAGALTLRAPAARAAATKQGLRVAFVGTGNRSHALLQECLQYGGNIVALCDVDERQLAAPVKITGKKGVKPRLLSDYRKLLDDASSFDAVVIATPDHWHAPLCRAFMQAGKHVYCEKPLTRTVGEARALRELARKSKVVTQLGNQGSAAPTLRRSVEIIQAGALGKVHEAHIWFTGSRPTTVAPNMQVADPVPAGFDWDFWCGPSPLRPYKEGIFHPRNWRRWWAFGSGTLGDFGCHGFNLPMRALDLSWPDRVEVELVEPSSERYLQGIHTRLHFPARGALAPFTLHWYDGDRALPTDALNDVLAVYKQPPQTGCLLIGDGGTLYADVWGKGGVLKLRGEPRLHGVLTHEATKNIPQSLPRTENHMDEWLQACLGRGKTFSDFDTGGKLTEIVLANALAVRLGRAIAWQGETMTVAGAPEAGKFIHPDYRTKWLVPDHA
jgi:predicted dehydrogenase